jgi:predicted kinase
MLPEDFAASVEKIYRALPGKEQTTATPVLFVISGLPGTGKSFLARKVAERLPCVIVESDFVRKTLVVGKPTYSGAESAFVHRVAHAVIERLLLAGCRVIYDATNLIQRHREKVFYLADKSRASIVAIHVIAPESVIRERLTRRFESRDPHDISDANWDVYQKLMPELEPMRHQHVVVDTSGDMDAAVTKIIRAAR